MKPSSIIVLALLGSSVLTGQELSRGAFRLFLEPSQTGTPSLHLTLKSSDNSPLTTIDRPISEDASLPRCELFSNGTILLVDAFSGVYELYGTNGRMLDRIPFDGKVRPDQERVVHMSGNGTFTALLISDPVHPNARLILLDPHGHAVVNRPVAGSNASGLQLSSDGVMIAAGTYEWNGPSVEHRTIFLRSDGTLVSSLAQEFTVGIWGQHDSLFLVYGKRSASVVNVRSGAVISHSSFDKGNIVMDGIWNGDEAMVALSSTPTLQAGSWIYQSLSIVKVGVPASTRQVQTSPYRSVSLRQGDKRMEAVVDGKAIALE